MCRPGVDGLTCGTCLTGYYNLTDEGCEECGCDVVGSVGVGCDKEGECACREGVRGRRCDECEEGYFNLTDEGCRSVRINVTLKFIYIPPDWSAVHAHVPVRIWGLCLRRAVRRWRGEV